MTHEEITNRVVELAHRLPDLFTIMIDTINRHRFPNFKEQQIINVEIVYGVLGEKQVRHTIPKGHEELCLFQLGNKIEAVKNYHIGSELENCTKL